MNKELINRLPSNWEQLTLESYLKILDLNIESVDEDNDDVELQTANNIDYYLLVASVLLDVDVSILRGLQMIEIIEIIKRLSFLKELPKPLKTSRYKWAKEADLSYDSFIQLNQIMHTKDYVKQFPQIIKLNLKDDVDLDNLPMTEVFTGFFLHKRILKKYLRHQMRLTAVQMIKEAIKKVFRRGGKNKGK